MVMNDASVFKLLTTGERVKFLVDGYNELFISRIEGFGREGEIVVGAPSYKGELLNLERDSEVTLQIIGQDALYRVRTRVLRQERSGGEVDVILLSAPENVSRIQRRKYVRVSTDLKLEVRLREEDASRYPEFRVVASQKPNISGGGIFLVTTRPLPLDTMVRLVLHVGGDTRDPRPLTTMARVAWIDTPDDDSGHYGVGFEFKDTDTKDRERIIHFVFNMLRERMKQDKA